MAMRLEYVAGIFVKNPVAAELGKGPAFTQQKVIQQALHRALEIKLTIALTLQHASRLESAYAPR